MTVRVLVVEDEPLIQMSIAMALEDAGYRVSTTETAEGAEQLDMLDEPDFILLDLNLGNGRRDGIEAAKTIRGRRKNVPIAFLTAHADDYSVTRMKVVQPCEIMSKPFNEDKVVKIIARHTGEAQ